MGSSTQAFCSATERAAFHPSRSSLSFVRLTSMGLEEEMQAFVKAGLAHHDSTCPMPAKAILLNPANHELFGWDEMFGVPVVPDERVQPKRFRIHCDGSAFGIEEALEAFQEAPVEPLVVPVGPGGPQEMPDGPFASS